MQLCMALTCSSAAIPGRAVWDRFLCACLTQLGVRRADGREGCGAEVSGSQDDKTQCDSARVIGAVASKAVANAHRFVAVCD